MRRDEDTITDDEAPASQGRFPGFQLRGELGRGGGGSVYRAWSLRQGQEVALKVAQAWAGPVARARFQREIRLLRELGDPGVVQIFDDGLTIDGLPFYAMELVDGGPLRPTGPARQRLERLIEVAQTLARLHHRGLFHRDLKPHNLLVDRSGRLRVADLGAALEADEERLTRTGRVVGTPMYMAPEQLVGEVADWARVDVWALGRVIAEICEVDSRAASTSGDGSLEGELRYIVRRATAEQPDDRYPTMADLLADLERARDGRPVRTTRRALWWQWRQAASRPVSAALAATLTLAVVLLAAAATLAARNWLEHRRQAAALAGWEQQRAQLPARYAESPADTEAWISSLTTLPAWTGTPAVAEAWLAVALLEREHGREARAGVDAARALALSVSDEQRARAVLTAVQAWEATADMQSLDVLVQDAPTLVALLPPEVARRVRRDVALAHVDIPTAWPLLDDDAHAVLAPFLQARRLPDTTLGLVDSDRDGALEQVLHHGSLSGRQADTWYVPWPHRLPRYVREVGQGDLLLVNNEWRVVWMQPDGASQTHRMLYGTVVDGYAVGALPSEGNRLWRLDRGGLSPLPIAGPPSTDNFTSATVADLDRDGVTELLVGRGAPWGFRLEVMTRDPATDRWALSRVSPRLGDVLSPADLGAGMLVGVVRTEYGSRWVFSAEDPRGGPCRLVRWDTSGDELRVAEERAFPHSSCGAAYLAADLAGDGVLDLVLETREGAQLIIPASPGHLGEIVHLGDDNFELGCRVVQADDDPAAEALVILGGSQDRQVWLVGAGGGPLPPQPIPRRPVLPTGDATTDLLQALSPAVAAEWVLHTAQSPEAHAEALKLSSRLWMAAGEPARAARTWQLRARLTDPPEAEALWSAAELWLGIGQTAEAEALLPELDRSSPAHAARLREAIHLRRSTTWAPPLDRPLPVRSPVPGAMRQDLVRGELRLLLPTGMGTLLRVPLQANGQPIWMEVTGRIERVEWAGDAKIALVRTSDDQDRLELGWLGRGAGGTLTRITEGRRIHTTCRSSAHHAATVPAASGTWPLQARVGDLGQGLVWLSEGWVKEGHCDVPPEAIAGERWDLVVEAGDGWADNQGQLVELVLTALRVGGMSPLPAEPAPVDPVLDAAARGQLSPTWEPDRRLAGLLRLQPSLWSHVDGAYADRLRRRVWHAGSRWHTDEPDVAKGLLALGPLTTLTSDDRAALLQARAEVLLHRGEEAAAEAQLRDVLALPGVSDWESRFKATTRLARLLAARGEQAEAERLQAEAMRLPPDEDLAERLGRTW